MRGILPHEGEQQVTNRYHLIKSNLDSGLSEMKSLEIPERLHQ
jgi:hypothetical protein